LVLCLAPEQLGAQLLVASWPWPHSSCLIYDVEQVSYQRPGAFAHPPLRRHPHARTRRRPCTRGRRQGTINCMTSTPTAPDAIRLTPTVTAVPYDHPHARRLTRALHADQLALYGFADDPDTTPEADFAPPQGLFLIASTGDEPVGCGGVRLLDEDTAEIKRMYVADQVRGQGIGRYLLEHLEHHAIRCGATRIMLETGRRNTAALALYHRAGYVPWLSYVPGRDQEVNRAMTKPINNSSRRPLA
jgi:GNAT superfamily N-acetyltransferase